MKRIACLLITASLLLSLSACSSNGSTSTTPDQEKTKITTKAATAATTTTKATTVATTAETTEEVAVGARTKPAVIGETIGMTSGGILALGVTVNSVTRGEDAKTIAMDENQFNEIPAGKELLLINVTFDLYEYTPDDDSSWPVSSYDFDYFDSTYAEIDNSVSLVIPEKLDGEMYAGASLTGNIYVLVDEGTQAYARLYENFWFDLSGF